jgi:hypothetical protein
VTARLKPEDLTRTPAVTSDAAEARVRACMALMPDRWERGKTAKRLAAEAGEGVGVWEHASAEAWRRHKAQDVGWVREYLCTTLLGAMGSARDIEDLRHQISAVVEVAKAWAPLVGAAAPTRVEVKALPADIPPWLEAYSDACDCDACRWHTGRAAAAPMLEGEVVRDGH